MDNILNITNGDCAVDIMKKADIDGDFLPRRDILHDGPVPKTKSLELLSAIRAKFIIDCGWGIEEKIKQSFIERDKKLKSSKIYKKVILWFEHDLYDQLQLLQILDWFYQNKNKETILSIICTEHYLGTLIPDEMMDLFKYEELVTNDHLSLSHKSWIAFREPSPASWYDLLKADTSILPFLKGAIIRLLEEYPSCFNGLSRTANQALKIVSEGETNPRKVFGLYQKSEERRYLGDSSFRAILNELLGSSPSLLSLSGNKKSILIGSTDQKLTITKTGKKVLSGKMNWLDIVKINKWIGGVNLIHNNFWSWDSIHKSLVNSPNNRINAEF
jgi:hypothetical protein